MTIVLAHPEPNSLLGDTQQGRNVVSRIESDESQPNSRALLALAAAELVAWPKLLVATAVKR
jgi:hypothetical protein